MELKVFSKIISDREHLRGDLLRMYEVKDKIKNLDFNFNDLHLKSKELEVIESKLSIVNKSIQTSLFQQHPPPSEDEYFLELDECDNFVDKFIELKVAIRMSLEKFSDNMGQPHLNKNIVYESPFNINQAYFSKSIVFKAPLNVQQANLSKNVCSNLFNANQPL